MQAICNVLSEVDSKNAQNYINRLDSYLTQIDEVDTEYKNAELDGKTIFVTHGAYSYLCNDYGMKQVALEGVTGDSDPSPSQMAKVVDQIKSEGISCIFYDPLEGDKMAQAVANEADIQALPLYTFEGDSESRDYVTVMKANLEELKKGFKNESIKTDFRITSDYDTCSHCPVDLWTHTVIFAEVKFLQMRRRVTYFCSVLICQWGIGARHSNMCVLFWHLRLVLRRQNL